MNFGCCMFRNLLPLSVFSRDPSTFCFVTPSVVVTHSLKGYTDKNHIELKGHNLRTFYLKRLLLDTGP